MLDLWIRGFSKATLRRSIGSDGGSRSLESRARMVQSRPPEKRIARLVFDVGAEMSLDGRILQIRSRSEARKRDSREKTGFESDVRLVGIFPGSALFMRGNGNGCKKRSACPMPQI